jgi:cytochrome c553
MIVQPRRRPGSAWLMRGSLLAALGLAALAASKASAGEAPPAVADIIHVCSSCHGLRGQSTSSLFPRLAGQQRDYILTQLKAFRDHSRGDQHAKTYMWGMAARLTDAQAAAIADYYATQPPVDGETDPSAQVTVGPHIYAKGIPSEKVPACVNCHGKNAEGQGATPRLAGQHPDYLARQLEWFASRARANQIMYESSRKLTPEQVEAVSAYLGNQ